MQLVFDDVFNECFQRVSLKQIENRILFWCALIENLI
jgi:hypothetical protein